MRFMIFISLLSVALCFNTPALAQDPNEEEGVRGSFLSSRADVTAAAGVGGASKDNRRTRRKPSAPRGRKTEAASGTKGASTNVAKHATGTSGGNKSVKNLKVTRIGLGYTLYMRDANGDPVRVDPSREFRAGDRIRISLETNTDGYLYVFHTENNGEPVMIFPDQRLDAGDNFVEAHVPYEIPWSGETDERLRWFVFDDKPATERLYIVLAREPLPGVPTGENLVTYCRTNQGGCPWRPASAMWTQVRVNSQAKAVVDKSESYGQVQTEREREATTRGLGLDQSAPEPSIIRMNVSATAPVLVTALDLIHK